MDIPHVLAVLDRQPGKVSLQLAIDPGLNVFKGHFDGAPIVPGIAQVYWALELANQYLQPVTAHDIEQMEAIKFHHVMLPGSEVLLVLELDLHKLVFAYGSGTTRYSSGRIALMS